MPIIGGQEEGSVLRGREQSREDTGGQEWTGEEARKVMTTWSTPT